MLLHSQLKSLDRLCKIFWSGSKPEIDFRGFQKFWNNPKVGGSFLRAQLQTLLIKQIGLCKLCKWSRITFGFFLSLGNIFLVCMLKALQLCPTLCDPMDYSPPGSSVHGILQAKILEWVSIFSSRGYSWPRIELVSLMSSALQMGSLPLGPPGKPILGLRVEYATSFVCVCKGWDWLISEGLGSADSQVLVLRWHSGHEHGVFFLLDSIPYWVYSLIEKSEICRQITNTL